MCVEENQLVERISSVKMNLGSAMIIYCCMDHAVNSRVTVHQHIPPSVGAMAELIKMIASENKLKLASSVTMCAATIGAIAVGARPIA